MAGDLLDSDFANAQILEEMYDKYQQEPSSVDSSWQKVFANLEAIPSVNPSTACSYATQEQADLQIINLINAYRTYGHLIAKTNPIAVNPQLDPYELRLETLGFTPSDLTKEYPTYGILKEPKATLEKMIETLKLIYCDKIGVEYKGLQNPALEKWLEQQIEPTRFRIDFSDEQKKMILDQLKRSELFESFLHTRYVGQKRFSLEGSETLILILEAIIEKAVDLGAEEFIIGMAHRGRLNVLANILKKSYADIFSEFEEGYIPESIEGSGDVKYHKGFYTESLSIHGHKVSISLTPNPSHLEAIDPVVEGQVRARQIIKKDENAHKKVIPILVHGDAALAGQGVVYETAQLYALPGYSTGGTIHVVVNNQIGFTTVPKDGRSTRYCTDIARAFGSPIFHVNAEDPEGCVYATILAIELRQKFHCDVYIDLVCYRKYGHNETDEPAFTQPLEYQIIRKKKSIREIYREELVQKGVISKELAENLEKDFKKSLQDIQKTLKESSTTKLNKTSHEAKEEWSFKSVDTGVDKKILQDLAKRFCTVPKGFHIHPKLEQLLKSRLEMVESSQESKPLDWGMAELLVYASLLEKGTSVRISGQDCCRGTFSHRHALWVDQVQEQNYISLQHLKEGQGRFDLINSPLSEYAVLGFEFGYSTANLDALVIWEAQFGDFANGAQLVTDQFIASGEQKWGQKSAVVMFLPHGYEGQGPDHSSGRIERFLSLAGNENMQITNPTTPAQFFHLLRRQILQPVKKPLIVFTPKGLLRHPDCISSIGDLTKGSFQEILDDPNPPKTAKRVVFCSGRIYYSLMNARIKLKNEDIVLIRIEQLYPLNIEKLTGILEKYKGCQEYIWAQEEPANMGAWVFVQPHLLSLINEKMPLKYVGRPVSASTATGSHAVHEKEHEKIINTLFVDNKPSIFEIASQNKL